MGSVEGYAGAGGVEGFDRGGGSHVLVADFYVGADGRLRLSAGNPVYVFDFADGVVQGLVFADDDLTFLRVDAEDVERFPG